MSKVYFYARHSTDKQDHQSQTAIVERYCDANGLTIDETVSESVSGSKDFRDRKIYTLLKQIVRGDTIIVSEISRLSRSMGDFSKILNDYFKPSGVRLIIANTGMVIDCSDINAMTEGILSMFSMSAQLEKELNVSRTMAGLAARREACQIAHDMGRSWFSKSGKEYPPGTNPFGSPNGPKIEYHKKKMQNNDLQTIKDIIFRMRKAGDSTNIIADELNRQGWPSIRGGKWYATSVCRILAEGNYNFPATLNHKKPIVKTIGPSLGYPYEVEIKTVKND